MAARAHLETQHVVSRAVDDAVDEVHYVTAWLHFNETFWMEAIEEEEKRVKRRNKVIKGEEMYAVVRSVPPNRVKFSGAIFTVFGSL